MTTYNVSGGTLNPTHSINQLYVTFSQYPFSDIKLPRYLNWWEWCICLKAFSVAGHKAWNSLLQSLRDIASTATFKRHLKTHLFNNILT